MDRGHFCQSFLSFNTSLKHFRECMILGDSLAFSFYPSLTRHSNWDVDVLLSNCLTWHSFESIPHTHLFGEVFSLSLAGLRGHFSGYLMELLKGIAIPWSDSPARTLTVFFQGPVNCPLTPGLPLTIYLISVYLFNSFRCLPLTD